MADSRGRGGSNGQGKMARQLRHLTPSHYFLFHGFLKKTDSPLGCPVSRPVPLWGPSSSLASSEFLKFIHFPGLFDSVLYQSGQNWQLMTDYPGEEPFESPATWVNTVGLGLQVGAAWYYMHTHAGMFHLGDKWSRFFWVMIHIWPSKQYGSSQKEVDGSIFFGRFSSFCNWPISLFPSL